MEHTSRHITEDLIDLLPEEKNYYRLTELREWGFPQFIVQRIQVELERNLADSMQLPHTDWANMESETVRNVWKQFLEAIRAEARLPASYAQTVIETAVAEVMEMLIQPRKKLPEVIFGREEELSREEIDDRLKAVVVYRHFSMLIPRYMEKKNLDTLTRERCAKVITNVDHRMTASYSPLNWAQMIEPLFNLLDEQIDTNLLRLFYEDKNMPRIARKFDLMDSEVSRAELIEVLSSPDSLNFEGYEDEQSDLFEGDTNGGETKPKDSPSSTSRGGTASPKERNKQEAKAEKEGKSPESPSPSKSREKEKNKETATLNTFFEKADRKEKKGRSREESDLNEIYSEESEGREESTLKEKSGNAGENKERGIKIAEINEASDEETPMWLRFMGPEQQSLKEINKQKEGTQKSQKSTEKEEGKTRSKSGGESGRKGETGKADTTKQKREQATDDDGFIEEPIIDLTENEKNSEEEFKKLNEILEEEREFFIEEIFRGSERAYDESIQNIASKEDWRSASKYIEKNIFKRNLVDMYSEAAVDFTDLLQSYFIEKSKS